MASDHSGLVAVCLPFASFAQEASTVSFQTQEHLQLAQLLQSIEPYRPTGDIQGKATLAGSTTMQLLGQNWSQRFKLFHPQVEFQRGAEGTNAGLEALAQDANTIVGVSRSVTEQEIAKLKAGACKDPIALIVALDPMAIYVHKDNPIAALTPNRSNNFLARRRTAPLSPKLGASLV